MISGNDSSRVNALPCPTMDQFPRWVVVAAALLVSTLMLKCTLHQELNDKFCSLRGFRSLLTSLSYVRDGILSPVDEWRGVIEG